MIPEIPQESTEQTASNKKASQQVRDCSSFIALLADQLEALEQQDFPRVREIELLRSRLAEEMRAQLDPETPLLIRLAEQVQDALAQIEGWFEVEQSTRDQLSQLQDESLPLVRGFQRRGGGGNYRPLDGSRTRLDLRL